MAITTNDLQIMIDTVNRLTNQNLSISAYHNVKYPYRLEDDRQQEIARGNKRELYMYLRGVLEGINSYKLVYNVKDFRDYDLEYDLTHNDD